MVSPAVSRTRGTVLVVEDSAEVQRYLRILLELDRYQVETANTGDEALQRLRDGCTPIIVLLDMQMPGMNGLETLQSMRKLRPELKVIMCSGVDDPDIVRQAILLGAQSYLVKPVQHLYLSAAVGRCLAGETGKEVDADPRARVITLPPPSCRPN